MAKKTLQQLQLIVAAMGTLILMTGGVMSAETASDKAMKNPLVVFSTTLGDITIELDSEKAPVTVENFLAYVDSGFFNGTIFHRVIPGFVIQGGGFTEQMVQKKTRSPIKNEAKNGLKNFRGTLSMARTNVVDSATSQFFISLKDNAMLDHQGERSFGYAVFGKVIEGMEVVDKVAAVRTGTRGRYGDVPVEAIVIQSSRRK